MKLSSCLKIGLYLRDDGGGGAGDYAGSGDDDVVDDDDDEHLEEGKHDEVLHPDADVDDWVEPTEGWTEVPLAWQCIGKYCDGDVGDDNCNNQWFGILTSESCGKWHGEYEHSTDGVDDAKILDQKKTDDLSLDLAVPDIEHDADVGDHGDEEDDEDEWALEGLQSKINPEARPNFTKC